MSKEEEAYKILSNYLSQVAESHNLSNAEVAEKCGLQPQTVKRIFEGKYPPSLEVFIRLCEACNVYLFIVDKDDDQSDLVEIMKTRFNSNPN